MGSFISTNWSPLWYGEYADFTELEDLYNIVMATTCVISAGLAAGLTMGLLSLDITKLEIKAMTGNTAERNAAISIIPIIKKHHLLLVTLLLFNSMSNEALPIFLGALVPNYVAIILAVTLILFFGEIIPSAFFTGPKQLQTAAKMIPFVSLLMTFLSPIAYPISLCLDYYFGHDEANANISRGELEALMLMQSPNFKRAAALVDNNNNTKRDKKKWGSNAKKNINDNNNGYQRLSNTDASNIINNNNNTDSNNNNNSNNNNINNNSNDCEEISHYEINIMTGILKLSKVCVSEVMIHMKDMYMLSDSIKLDDNILHAILRSGYSRIPIFKRKDKQHIKGYLLVKSLVIINPNDKIAIESLALREPLVVRPTLGLIEMLNMFREGECHLALVSKDPMKTLKSLKDGDRPMEAASIVGMVTLEDVIEKMIQYDIVDETDVKPNKYPKNSCSSTLLYHNVGKSGSGKGNSNKTYNNIIVNNDISNNNVIVNDSNIDTVKVHSINSFVNNDELTNSYQNNI